MFRGWSYSIITPRYEARPGIEEKVGIAYLVVGGSQRAGYAFGVRVEIGESVHVR